MKQTDRLLDYLKRHGRITGYDALIQLGIFRCASRISELKKDGWDIRSERTKVLNRWGESAVVADYILNVEDQGRLAI